jgi:hypothetical protein
MDFRAVPATLVCEYHRFLIGPAGGPPVRPARRAAIQPFAVNWQKPGAQSAAPHISVFVCPCLSFPLSPTAGLRASNSPTMSVFDTPSFSVLGKRQAADDPFQNSLDGKKAKVCLSC